MRYTIVITPEPDGSAYNAMVPALPGCLSCGDTLLDALANIREAIELYLEDDGPVTVEPPAVEVYVAGALVTGR